VDAITRVVRLFVRGDETIRINVSVDGLSITTNGPGHERRIFNFGDEPTASEFIRLYEHFLTHGGWALQAFVERRSSNSLGGVPEGGDRRRSF
jgi:hypothetical protein